MILKATAVLGLFLICMPSIEAARTIPYGQEKQGEAPPNVPNIPATTGDIPSPMNTQMASSVDTDDHSDASPFLRRLLRAPPISSTPNPPGYIPPSKNIQHAPPSQASKQNSTHSSSMTMPKGSTSTP
ncbi:hypothetical protein CMV_018753 [Castanea mollissima]|uniref:Uncharacterized protein n=1 Tax=Castanea mollissima TaxID=60419 RepID=A0A8J4R1R5_9ROSI|nr:hypothetical protein CMV_018753 [Castanea mollissima]